jgi:predicted amidophosphoribosyltransferase
MFRKEEIKIEKTCIKCTRRCRHESGLCSACRSGMTDTGIRRRKKRGEISPLFFKMKNNMEVK